MRRSLRPLAHLVAVLVVLGSQFLSIWLTNPRFAIRTDRKANLGYHLLDRHELGDLPVFVYSAVLLEQAVTHPSTIREVSSPTSCLSLFPVLGLARDATLRFVQTWIAVHLGVSLLLLGEFSLVAYHFLRRRLPAKEAVCLATLIPFWWLVLGCTAWLYAHMTLTPEVAATVALALEPALIIVIATNILLLTEPAWCQLLRVPVRFRFPLPLAFLDLVIGQYLVLTHGFPYEGWYDTYPPVMFSSFILAWPPVTRLLTRLYPVLAQPAAALLSYVRSHPDRIPAFLLDLGQGARESGFFLYLSLANTMIWTVGLGLIVAVVRSRARRPDAATEA